VTFGVQQVELLVAVVHPISWHDKKATTHAVQGQDMFMVSGRPGWHLWQRAPLLCGANVIGAAVQPLALQDGEDVPAFANARRGNHWALVVWLNLTSVQWARGKPGQASILLCDSMSQGTSEAAWEQERYGLSLLAAREASDTLGIALDKALKAAEAIPWKQACFDRSSDSTFCVFNSEVLIKEHSIKFLNCRCRCKMSAAVVHSS
jgi:hypothetical protein